MYDLHNERRRELDEILVLGETTWRRTYRRFGLLPADRLRHVWTIGKTGSGKSTLLANLIAQDLARGNGVAVLDPHGDLIEAALAAVPRRRTNDVLLFDPSDTEYPIAWNIFQRGAGGAVAGAMVASTIISIMKKQWADSWGPRLEHVLRNAILAVAPDPRATLLFLYRFLTDRELREEIVARTRDPLVRLFWTNEFGKWKEQLQAEATSPVLNKLGAFVTHPTIRMIVGQPRSRVHLSTILERRGIILAKLSAGAIGEDAAHLLGGLILSSLFLAATARRTLTPAFYVVVDEFQHFTTDSIATILSEARKFGLGLTLAHQYLGQLGDTIRDAVIGNVGTSVIFRVGGADAEALEPEFEPIFTALDLESLPRFHMAVKLIARGEALQPFSARSLPPCSPPPDAARREEIVSQSRARFARPRREIEAFIYRDLSSA